MSIDTNTIRVSLAVLALPRIGRKTAPKILDAFGEHLPMHADELCDALKTVSPLIPRLPVIHPDEAKAACMRADQIIESCANADIRIIAHGDTVLPSRFWRIDDPPFLMYSRGSTAALSDRVAMAIIGTREPTDYGSRAGHRFASRCAEAGLVVVSGLAIGCDSAAHVGCLDGRGITVAVMAHGLETVHPARNRELATRIIDEGGCLISEYPPGTDARPNLFIERDRLQSAMANGVLVVETDVKGGTMHTVRFAQVQRRLLACLAHPSDLQHEPKTRGNQKLIADGVALPVADAADLQSFIQRLVAEGVNSSPASAADYPSSLWEQGNK